MRVFPNGTGLSLALLAVCALAWLSPEIGLEGGPLFPQTMSRVAVFIIFLIQGWKLEIAGLKGAWIERRMFFFLHYFIFFIPPALIFVASFSGMIPAIWMPGLFFLSVLPTTISTCVVFSRSAGGDPDSALAHATLSNLLAMVLVPLFVVWGFSFFQDKHSTEALFSKSGDMQRGALDAFGHMFPGLCSMVILPCVIGWWSRNKAGSAIFSGASKGMDQVPFACILLLAYFSFCSLFDEWGEALLSRETIILSVLVVCFLAFVSLFGWFGGRFACLSKESRVTFFYCSSQKSLAMGLPMAQMLCGSDGGAIGLLILPLALFHFGQLLLGALLIEPIRRWGGLR